MSSRFPMPPEIREVYLDFDWDKRKVWVLDLASSDIDRARLEWHLDLPFWSSRPPAPLFDLVPRDVIRRPDLHPAHARRIRDADLDRPIDVMHHRGRLCIMDGIHRLAKATLQCATRVKIRRVPRSAIPSIRPDP